MNATIIIRRTDKFNEDRWYDVCKAIHDIAVEESPGSIYFDGYSLSRLSYCVNLEVVNALQLRERLKVTSLLHEIPIRLSTGLVDVIS